MNQLKFQQKTSECYSTIVNAPTENPTEFHTDKLKEERSYRVLLKIFTTPSTQNIAKSKLGHTVTNIWNIKTYRTKLTLSMVFADLKTNQKNRDIFELEYIQQCRIKFEPPKYKRDIAQCANCQIYGDIKNYLVHPRCVTCAGDYLTNQWQHKERSSNVRCVLCGGNHPQISRDILSTKI
jgi:hypothetical protein